MRHLALVALVLFSLPSLSRADPRDEVIRRLEQDVADLREEIDRLNDWNLLLEARIKRFGPLVARELASKDPARVEEALSLAVEAGLDEAVPVLTSRLDAGDPDVRLKSAERLLRMKWLDLALPTLQAWASDESLPSATRLAAVELLIDHAPWTVLPSLDPLAATLDTEAFLGLARRIADLDDPRCIPLCLERAKDPAVVRLLEEIFGGPPPAGMDFAAVYDATRAPRLGEVRAAAAALRQLRSQRVTFALRDRSMSEVVDFLRSFTDLGWICLPDAAELKVSYECEEKLLHDAVEELLGKAGLAYLNLGGVLLVGRPEVLDARAAEQRSPVVLPPRRPDESPWIAEIRRMLDTPVTAEFEETEPQVVLDFLAAVHEVRTVPLPLVADSEAVVSLSVNGMRAADLLDLVCRECGLEARPLWGALVVGTPREFEALGKDGDLERASAGSEETSMILATTTVDLDFDETPLREALLFLSGVANVEIVAEKEVDQARTLVTLRADGLSLRNALRLALRPHGLTIWIEKERVVVLPVP